MTLYQRIYACKDVKTAKRAWRIAGLFEWPIMAFMGVALGLFSRVAFEQGMFAEIGFAPGSQMDAELGLPLLLSNILPVGLMGLMMSAYFSAIMSTADSCLMAASGNFMTDIMEFFRPSNHKHAIRHSQLITLVIGGVAMLLATMMHSVLDLMLYSYAFMVSGLLVPVVGSLVYKKPNALAAMMAMILGGSTTLTLIILNPELPYGLDANFFGISISAITFLIIQNTAKTDAKYSAAQ
jgi:SSS family solute:Na+ symporter